MIRKLPALPGGAVRLSMPGLLFICAAVIAGIVLTSCHRERPSVSFTQIPSVSAGGADFKGIIAGRAAGFKPGERILIYASAEGRWWIQPFTYAPYTDIKPDGTWSAEVHLGMQYAAVLVSGNDHQRTVIPNLPEVGGNIRAVTTVHGSHPVLPLNPTALKILHFGGYDWEVTSGNSGFGGRHHYYVSENVWLDPSGAMHLRVSHLGNQWICGEARVTRTLGYGTYRWRVRDVAHLEPAAMLSMFTWADSLDQHHREIDVHISRWGDPTSKSGEYVIQPYYLPANVYRFDALPGPLSASFRWTNGRVDFVTSAGKDSKPHEPWTFTSGVPSTSDEKISLNLCEFGYAKHPLQHENEVVIEQFEFLP